MLWDVIVIGAGASGHVAALTAARAGAKVLMVEKQHRVGRRLAATGNGTCNLSHHGFGPADYNSEAAYFVEPAFHSLDEAATLAFFDELGLATEMDERERYYPVVRSASVVVDVLRYACEEAGIRTELETEIQSILRTEEGYLLASDEATFHTRAVVVCAGGEAAPRLGGSRSGYALLQALGHELRPTRPAIVQLVCKKGDMRGLRGLHWPIELSVPTRREAGEVLFTEDGLSGPVTLQLSRVVSERLATEDGVWVWLDLWPAMDKEALTALLKERAARFPDRALSEFLVGLLPRPLANQLWRRAGIGPLSRKVSSLRPYDLEQIAGITKSHIVQVVATRGFGDAQVALGGISLKDFNPETLESWIAPGIFAAGEVLDVTGDCGGYNLQWAWSSGYLAGMNAARYSLQ